MRKMISLKGVLLGALADVVGSNLSGMAIGMYLFSAYHLYSLPYTQQANKLTFLMMHNSGVVILIWVIGGGFSILGGYVAARVARHNELLNGTLSSFLCVLFTLLAIGRVSFFDIAIGIIGNPVLGLLGGYLRLLQKRNVFLLRE